MSYIIAFIFVLVFLSYIAAEADYRNRFVYKAAVLVIITCLWIVSVYPIEIIVRGLK